VLHFMCWADFDGRFLAPIDKYDVAGVANYQRRARGVYWWSNHADGGSRGRDPMIGFIVRLWIYLLDLAPFAERELVIEWWVFTSQRSSDL